MADMLVELIQKFIDGADATLNSLFKSMVNLVFFIERELNAIQVQGGSKIDFNGIYQVIFSYACFILVIVFIAKLVKIYFLQSDGDSEKSPIHLIIGMMKAVIVMICCKEIYDLFIGIVSNFLDSILNAMPVQVVSLSEALSGNIAGIEMLLMRMGIPFATIGLLNSDEGVFPEYIRGFLMTAFTLVVQLALVNLSILVMVNGHLIYAIAIAITAVNTPMLLSKYLVRPNGSIINSAGNMARNLRALLPRRRR